MPPLILDIAYLVIFILAIPFSIYKTCTSVRFRSGWANRFSFVPKFPKVDKRVWVHCASVGEVMLAKSFISVVRGKNPGAEMVISTNTNTGREAALKNLPDIPVIYFPLDFSFIVRRVFRRIKPTAIVLVELELWPNFLTIASRKKIPVAVVNGRITERSAQRYGMFGFVAEAMFSRVSQYAVQNDDYAQRLNSLGVNASKITNAGTMKYDSVATSVPDELINEYRLKMRIAPDDKVLFGGCTHTGEDEPLLDYAAKHRAEKIQLVIAPRHRERMASLENLVREKGFEPVKKSDIDAGRAPEDFEARPHVILIDTTGELAKLYGIADVVFVGGSLVKHGGQNMIEPAALAKPTVFGPHTSNFRDTVAALLKNHSAIEADFDTLFAAFDRLFSDENLRKEMGAGAQKVVVEMQGAALRNYFAVKDSLRLA